MPGAFQERGETDELHVEEEAREEESFAPKLHRSSMTTRDSASSKRIVHFCTVVMDLKTAKHGYTERRRII
jgi:hypothetical protein